jgi:hypothetical protein
MAMSDAERQILSRPGSWVVGLMATNSQLTPLLVKHVQDTGDIVGSELLADFYWWYVDAANLGVDLGQVNAYLEAVARRADPEVLQLFDFSFLGALRAAHHIPEQRERAHVALEALPPTLRKLAQREHGL